MCVALVCCVLSRELSFDLLWNESLNTKHTYFPKRQKESLYSILRFCLKFALLLSHAFVFFCERNAQHYNASNTNFPKRQKESLLNLEVWFKVRFTFTRFCLLSCLKFALLLSSFVNETLNTTTLRTPTFQKGRKSLYSILRFGLKFALLSHAFVFFRV